VTVAHENVDIKRAKMDEISKNNPDEPEEFGQIKDQIKKMSFEYVKLTFVLKVDQLRTEVKEGVSFPMRKM
jgi:hypothetical protein